MYKTRTTVFFFSVLILISITELPAFAWAPMPPKFEKTPAASPFDENPPSAPEPISMILIGMGVSGVAGYFIGRRTKK